MSYGPARRRRRRESRLQPHHFQVLSSHWEPPETLDTAGVIVNAVYVTIPASAWTYLEDHPNPRAHNGKYRPMQRYGQDFERKHVLASICRQYWRLRVPKRWVNRVPGQPCFRYLPMDLVAQLVRCLLDEFRFREGAFVSPFPRFETSETDYWTWEFEAIQRVQETLQMEALGEPW